MNWTLILTGIGTVATIISTIVAISAKHEAKRILQQIKEEIFPKKAEKYIIYQQNS